MIGPFYHIKTYTHSSEILYVLKVWCILVFTVEVSIDLDMIQVQLIIHL